MFALSLGSLHVLHMSAGTLVSRLCPWPRRWLQIWSSSSHLQIYRTFPSQSKPVTACLIIVAHHSRKSRPAKLDLKQLAHSKLHVHLCICTCASNDLWHEGFLLFCKRSLTPNPETWQLPCCDCDITNGQTGANKDSIILYLIVRLSQTQWNQKLFNVCGWENAKTGLLGHRLEQICW